ncbi:prolyl oligopeptidase family serine peptidase [Sphingomonas yunnanensis]|uniref:alpha/beta hydrolase family protein n=1 Tax=Sphingomonas yunnanensis TaxID=310400 RepID=UPI001CA7196F|nr:prolyl oligopeptidase family serine peptidase [Sphingomonas yunnanensis]MBY9062284.1 prolyl oligopeptidase family serine peptidase [Sphingomonas yunnanensis]
MALGCAIGAFAEQNLPGYQRKLELKWIDFTGPPTISIPSYGAAAGQKARFASATKRAPLVIDLHQWSEDQSGTLGDDARLDKLVTAKGWNYIRPALAGPNNKPSACCSPAIIDGIKAAISYAVQHGKVDQRAIYIVGESGGAYTALCGAQSGALPIRAYYAWVPITDLTGWHSVHRDDHYGDDVMACTGSHGSLNTAEARRRSPLFMPLPQKMPALHIFHGIRDGMTTSVSPEHSIRYFNRIATERGFSSAVIEPEVERDVLYSRTGPEEGSGRTVGGRAVHLFRKAGNTTLTIFEGKHEGLMKPTMRDLAKDWATIRAGS